MIKPPCFTHVGAAIVSLVVLAACVPSENVETGAGVVARATFNAAPGPGQDSGPDSGPESGQDSGQDEMVTAAPAGPPPRPPAPKMPVPTRLMGLDPAVIMGLLGEPTWRRLDGHTQVYSFVSKDCRANAYFMRADETAPFLLNHAEFRPSGSDNEGLSAESCLASFFQTGDIPSILLKDAGVSEASPK